MKMIKKLFVIGALTFSSMQIYAAKGTVYHDQEVVSVAMMDMYNVDDAILVKLMLKDTDGTPAYPAYVAYCQPSMPNLLPSVSPYCIKNKDVFKGVVSIFVTAQTTGQKASIDYAESSGFIYRASLGNSDLTAFEP